MIKNLTVVAPEPSPARVAVRYDRDGDVDGIPVYRAVYGDVEGLPSPPQDGVYCVVSMLVAGACPRPDVFSPGDLIRDDGGRPVGCRGLKRS